MKDIRNSNFEALRIIAILMITAYHYVVHGVGNMAIGGGMCCILVLYGEKLA